MSEPVHQFEEIDIWRADELLAQNDFLVCTVWMRIVHAIGDLAREKPREGEAVN